MRRQRALGCAQQRTLGGAGIHDAGADLPAGRVDEVGDDTDQPIRGKLGIELAGALAAVDQRADRAEWQARAAPAAPSARAGAG